MTRLAAVLVAALAVHASAAEPDPLDAERDALIDKITRGVEYDASVKRLGELIAQHDAIEPTSEKARAAARVARDWRTAYAKTPDAEVAWRCTLSPDPAHPLPSNEGRFRADWGKVTRKETVQIASASFGSSHAVTLYEVAGVAGPHVFRGERFGPFREDVTAKVGDLMMVCVGSESLDRDLPPAWGTRSMRSGFAFPVERPALIVEKARWAPIHLTNSAFYWAIHKTEWKWPGQHVLANLEIGRDLGGGRHEVLADLETFVIEVSPTVGHRDLLVPGHRAWLILGDARFDAALGRLVLVAKDIEAAYVFPRARQL
jgi:hypothetical protein